MQKPKSRDETRRVIEDLPAATNVGSEDAKSVKGGGSTQDPRSPDVRSIKITLSEEY